MRHAVRSLRVLVDGHLAPRTLVIDNGFIAAVEPYSFALPAGVAVEDVGDLVVMAGVTDVHVHVNDPGRTDWEGFATATLAASAGGVTTLVDMPLNSTPVTTTAEAFAAKLAAAKGALRVDVGYWGGVVPEDIDELPGLLASGVLGLKAFLVHSGIEDFPNVTEADLRRALPLLAPTKLPLLVHCELALSPAGAPTDPGRYLDYLASRPGQWEVDAIALVLKLCRETGARVHIVHLSAAEALPMLRAAKADGLPITVETCPHYLVLEAESIPDDTRFKCAPPIRGHENREQLWAALAEGTIDFIATDHSPCPPELKKLGEHDFTKAWGGIASLQFLLPLVWSEARARGFGLAEIERWLCSRPAAFAGLKDKGRIAAGYRADLVAWDPNESFTITEEAIAYRHKITPYGGRTWHGAVHRTWVGGAAVWDGKAVGGPRGRSLLRSAAGFQALPDEVRHAALLKCCASPAWADAVLRNNATDFGGLARAAGDAWWALTDEQRREAYRGHAKIGDKYRQNKEQAGVVGASEATLKRLAEANDEYFAKFGFVFLVFATGKTADQMLAMLEARLVRTQAEEVREAALQHHKITLFRLAQLEANHG